MSLSRNLCYNLLLKVANIALPLITIPYITRVLGKEAIGSVSFTSSIVQYFILAGTLGTRYYGIRAIAFARNNRSTLSETFWEICFIKLVTSFLSLVTFACFIHIFLPEFRFLFYIQTILLFGSAVDITWFFMGLEDFKSTVITTLLVRLISVVAIFSFIKSTDDFLIYAFISAISTLITQAILWTIAKNTVDMPERISLAHAFKKHISSILRIFLGQVAIQIYVILDQTMLGLMVGVASVGIYAMSQKLVKVLLSLLTSLGEVMLPRASNLLGNNDTDGFYKNVTFSFNFVSYVAIPASALLAVMSPILVPLLFGQDFLQAIPVMAIICPIIVFISWSNVLGVQVLLPLKREWQFNISVAAAAIINFSINLTLIPRYGSLGAAVSSVIAELCVVLVQQYFLKDVFWIFKGLHLDLAKYLIGGIFIVIGIEFLKNILMPMNSGLFLFIGGIVSGLIYLSLMWILKSNIQKIIFQRVFSRFIVNFEKPS